MAYWEGKDYQLLRWNQSDQWVSLTNKILGQAPLSHVNLLDVGCGIGTFIQKAEKWYPKMECFGTEIDPHLLTIAKGRFEGHRKYQMQRTEDIPWRDELFDWVTCIHVLQEVRSPAALLQEIKRVLVPEGRVTLVVPNLWHRLAMIPHGLVNGLRQKDKHEWSPTQLKMFLYSMGFYWVRVGTFGDHVKWMPKSDKTRAWLLAQAHKGL